MVRTNAVINRPVDAGYHARTAYDFIILMVLAVTLCVLTLLLSDSEQTFLSSVIGCAVGAVVYGFTRIAFGRRLFFKKRDSTTSRIVSITLVLIIPVAAILFPEFRKVLIDSIWFLIAVCMFAALRAFEGLIRKEWKKASA